MPLCYDCVTVISAIGNHDESTGSPEDVISAALIIADKTDVRRRCVRQKEPSAFDLHELETTFKLTVNGRKVL